MSAETTPLAVPLNTSIAHDRHVKLLLITSNVGSIFEETEEMLPAWIEGIAAAIDARQPQFVAIHMQEVGGKSYKSGIRLVNGFLALLDAHPVMQQFNKRMFHLHRDYTTPHFTALGSLYYIHHSVKHVQSFDFVADRFTHLPAGCDLDRSSSASTASLAALLHSQTLSESSPIFASSPAPHEPCYQYTQHEKFPESFFPQCSWSRKGFLRTKWCIGESPQSSTSLDLINIHLFHDDSNILAVEKSPSIYAENRIRALKYVLKRCGASDSVPQVYFGDVNFRLDVHRVVRYLTSDASPQVTRDSNGNETRVVFRMMAPPLPVKQPPTALNIPTLEVPGVSFVQDDDNRSGRSAAENENEDIASTNEPDEEQHHPHSSVHSSETAAATAPAAATTLHATPPSIQLLSSSPTSPSSLSEMMRLEEDAHTSLSSSNSMESLSMSDASLPGQQHGQHYLPQARSASLAINIPRIRTPSPISSPAFPLSPISHNDSAQPNAATSAAPTKSSTTTTATTSAAASDSPAGRNGTAAKASDLLSPTSMLKGGSGGSFAKTSPSSSPSAHVVNQQQLFPPNAVVLEKKTFIVPEPGRFLQNKGKEFQQFNQEGTFLDNPVLHEFPITFAPSYPFSEDAKAGSVYMTTRCPSWCDRVLLTKAAFDAVQAGSLQTATHVEYDLAAQDACVGDHKPVLLSCLIPYTSSAYPS